MTAYKQHLLCGLTALSLLAPLTSFANSAAFESGFYAGIKMGGQQTMVSQESSSAMIAQEINLNGSVESTTVWSPVERDDHEFHTNVLGNVNVGYAKVVDQFFLAAELSINLAAEQELDWERMMETESEANNGVYGENITSEVTLENPDLIFDLRPGLLLTKNFLLYGRIGTAYNRLSIEQEGVASYLASAIDIRQVNFPVSSDDSDDVFGLRVGLGIEHKFTPNLAVNVDYVFTDYGDIDTEFTTTQAFIDDTGGEQVISAPSISTKADVTKSIATIGFSWYFGGKKHGIDK